MMMNERPKISVVIPAYNGEKYLRQCLNTVINQTLREIEIICIDAGSTDNTLEILKEFEQKDSRVRVCAKERLDAGAARNIGLSMANGEYLAFWDSDDFFDKEALQETYAKIKDEQSDILVFYSRQFDMRTGQFKDMPWSLRIDQCPQHRPFTPSDMPKFIFNTFQNWTWNKLFRRDFIQNNNIVFQEIERTNDMAFTCQALAMAQRISILPKTYITYRIGTGTSLQQTNDLSPTSFWNAYIETKRRLQEAGVYEKYKQSFINAVLGGTIYNLESVKSEAAYHDILFLLKYRADIEFELSSFPKSYFYNPITYEKYKEIVANTKLIKERFGSPKVSIVMPCLNNRKYIRECIESAIEQTLDDIEILFVDAGSTDGTIEIVNQYAEIDSRIKIINADKKSYGYQMNLGLDAAKGEYFAILETDDYVDRNMYEVLYEIAKKYDLDFVKADFRRFVGSGKQRKYEYVRLSANKSYYNKVLNPWKDRYVFRANNVSWSGIYSIDFLRKNDIRHNETPGASYQDNGFWFQVFMNARRIMFYDKAFYQLRRDNPNSSVFSKSKVFCMCDEYDYIRERMKLDKKIEEKYADLCAYYRYLNYMWTVDRITDTYIPDFIKRFSEDFKKLERNGELNKALYSKEQWDRIQSIINNSDEYCKRVMEEREALGLKKEDQVAQLKRELIRTKKKAESLEMQLRDVHNSVSFRIGRKITWLPRKIRGGIRCYKENGFRYTVIRGLQHLRIIKNDTNKLQYSGRVTARNYEYWRKLPQKKYEEELKKWYFELKGVELDLDNPKTFNEKIQWLKLYDSTPMKTKLADKYLVREWVKETVGEKYLVKLLGVWDRFDDIDFTTLPDRFVLKANHASGWNIIVRDKASFNYIDAKKKFDLWMSRVYGYEGLELHYTNIPRKIIAEEYIAGLDGDIFDYRFFCFNGEPKFLWVDVKSGTPYHERNIYDVDWNLLDYKVNYGNISDDVSKPENYSEMLDMARIMCKGFSFVRIDLYNIDGRIYFGEMTFTPQSGKCRWDDESQNEYYGSLIQLPKKSPFPPHA